MAERPRVLVIAEAANPEWVSVPLIGWSLSQALREVADVHLVTQVRNRAAILRAGLDEGRDFTAIDSEKVAAPLYKAADLLRMGKGRGWTMITAVAGLAYPYFERLAWQRFGAGIEGGEWDVVHRVTPLSPTTASLIAPKVAAAGVPFVLGPLNGGVPWPPGFEAERRAEREWLSYVRGLYRLNPAHGRTLRSASAIVVGSRHTEGEMPAWCRDRCVYLPENAVDPARFGRAAPQAGDGWTQAGPLRGVFVGRLVPYKGADMALAASAPLLRDGRMMLDIVGDGPMRGALEALVRREGVGEAVTLHGNLPHSGVADVLARANLLVFPSIREFGGGVVLEAMATGVVPLVVDYAGPAELVGPEVGVKVPLGPREAIVAGVRAELERFAADPAQLGPLARAARARALDRFTWSAKARQLAEVYDWVTGRRPDRPTLF